MSVSPDNYEDLDEYEDVEGGPWGVGQQMGVAISGPAIAPALPSMSLPTSFTSPSTSSTSSPLHQHYAHGTTPPGGSVAGPFGSGGFPISGSPGSLRAAKASPSHALPPQLQEAKVQRSQSLRDPVEGGGAPPPLPPPNPGMRKFGKHTVVAGMYAGTTGAAANPPSPARVNFSESPRTKESSDEPLPPPLPPKPSSRTIRSYSLPSEPTEQSQVDSSDLYNVLDEELTLAQLVETHKDSFPLRVRVCKGFYGVSDKTSVSEGDEYSIHFVKNTDVVKIVDSTDTPYEIAFNSAIKFGMFYNPEGDEKLAREGYIFPKVSDILSLSVLPKVIRSTVAHRGSSAESTVEENELFIIHEVKSKLGRKSLKVYSLSATRFKHLSENCEGNFSTKPYDTRLFLPEICEQVPNPFPLDVMLFVSTDVAQDLPIYLSSTLVTLKGKGRNMSLIASCSSDDPGSPPILMDIPLDLDIEVQIMEPKQDDKEHLYEETTSLFEQFNPGNVIPYFTKATSTTFETQAAFMSTIREGSERAGISLEAPSCIKKQQKQQQQEEVAVTANGSSGLLQSQQLSNGGGTGSVFSNGVNLGATTTSGVYSETTAAASSYDAIQATAASGVSTSRSTDSFLSPSNQTKGQNAPKKQQEKQQKSPSPLSPKLLKKFFEHPKSSDVAGSPSHKIHHSHTTKIDSRKIGQYDTPTLKTAENSPSRKSNTLPKQTHLLKQQQLIYHKPNATDGGTDEPSFPTTFNPLASSVATTKTTSEYTALPTLSPSHINVSRAQRDLTSLHADIKRQDIKILSVGEDVSKLKEKMAANTSDVSQWKEETGRSIASVQELLMALQAEVQKLKASQSHSGTRNGNEMGDAGGGMGGGGGGGLRSDETTDPTERNINYLKRLDAEQLLQVLDGMDLPQYKQLFLQEHLTGEVLAELDDYVLKDELGIKHKLHRVRIMKLISGKHSAQSILRGDGNYGELKPVA